MIFPNPKFILIMNYILLFLFAAMTALTANAQVETEAKSVPVASIDYYIPEQFRLYPCFGEIYYLEFSDNPYEEPKRELRIYDENLEVIKKFPLLGYPSEFRGTNLNAPKDHFEINVTQTLFNNDEKFEYVLPIEIEEDDGQRTYIGCKIISEDGTVLQTLNIPDNIEYPEMTIYIIGDNYYLAFDCYEGKDGNTYTDFYKISKDASDPSKVSISTEPKRMNVSPRMVGRNEDITVAAETEDLRDVVVTDASGRRVYSTRVSDGQRAVRINANRLSPGMNVVNVKDANGKNEDFKVIVK